MAFRNPQKVEKHKKAMDPGWEFHQPEYDERSGCYIRAGTNYGVGMAPKVGSESVKEGYAIPTGRVETMQVDEIHRGETRQIKSDRF